ncbi:MAG: hypothetical protein Q7S03_00590 [bacterium]|nr:hypothetical protein [bacterium]
MYRKKSLSSCSALLGIIVISLILVSCSDPFLVKSVPTPTIAPSHPEVAVTYYFRPLGTGQIDSLVREKQLAPVRSLEEIKSPVLPYFYDEDYGPSFKVSLDRPSEEIQVVEVNLPGKQIRKIADIREFYSFHAKQTQIWVLPRSLSKAEERDEESFAKIGQLIFTPPMFDRLRQSGNLYLPEDYPLNPRKITTFSEFEGQVASDGLVGIVMTEGDAKRYAFYETQPAAKVEKWYGWTFPTKLSPGQCSKTTLLYSNTGRSLNKQVDVQAGKVSFVNFRSYPAYPPQGTWIRDGLPRGPICPKK